MASGIFFLNSLASLTVLVGIMYSAPLERRMGMELVDLKTSTRIQTPFGDFWNLLPSRISTFSYESSPMRLDHVIGYNKF
jgi:hypothetical protein